MADLLERLEDRQDRLALRCRRRERLEQRAETRLPGVVFLLDPQHRGADRIEVRDHEIGELGPIETGKESGVRGDEVETRGVQHEPAREQRLEDPVGASLSLGARVPFLDVLVDVLKARDRGHPADGLDARGVLRKPINLARRKPRKVCEPGGLRRERGFQPRRRDRGEGVRTEGRNLLRDGGIGLARDHDHDAPDIGGGGGGGGDSGGRSRIGLRPAIAAREPNRPTEEHRRDKQAHEQSTVPRARTSGRCVVTDAR
jgi:hypothetical protein